MKIITSGSKYIDIDAYASCIAYRELFKLKGIEAISVSTSKLNESITKQILEFKQSLDSYQESEEQEFIILDVSEEIYFDTIVKKEKIVELIDHHPGFETVWKEKLGEKAQIETIGAVATIILEKYQEEHLLNKMEKEVAYMLMAAILDNTLNFKAKITSNRDIMAYQKLQKKFMCSYDDAGNIGKRYHRSDIIGTPFVITVDDETINNNTVTLRDRDTTEQITLNVDEVEEYINKKVGF